MTPPRSRLSFESLEDRTVPTALGSPWPIPGALTLSFAQDGTQVGPADSGLFTEMSGTGTTAAWQREILRAFQTWAVQTNANIGLVADGGAAFGTPGQAEGDFRFGDIRIGAVPLSADSLANALPFNWSVGTWSGDVLFNTLSKFAINPSSTAAGADLFTVALHEAGHVFGLDHSTTPGSAMTEGYTGKRTGLSAADIATIQSYYGARQPDQYEGANGNNTAATATPVDALTGAAKLTADIQTTADSDNYSLLNTSLLGTLTVRVKTSGISLLAPQVQVYDAWGRLLASAKATGPGQDLALDIPKTLLNLGYTVRVTGATGDVFGVGGYELSVVRKDGLGTLLTPLVKDGGLVSSLLDVVSLDKGYTGSGDKYALDATLDSKTDVDYYSVTAPRSTDAAGRAMVVSVQNTSGKGHPDLAVFDAAGHPVAFEVLNNDGATLTIQVRTISRGATYYVRVTNAAGGADTTGRYRLTADFQQPAASSLQVLDAGHLDAGKVTGGGVLKVTAARVFQFSLESQTGAQTGATVTLTVRDAAGNVVLTLNQAPGGPAVNKSVYLAAGSYSVEVRLVTPAGQATPTVDYWLYFGEESDPMGPYSPDSTGDDSAPMMMSDDSADASAPPPSDPGSDDSTPMMMSSGDDSAEVAWTPYGYNDPYSGGYYYTF